jgi:hypothetical protein
MDSPLVVVFLAVIALAALVQAGFVGALAYALRMGSRKLDLLEEQFEKGVVPQIRNAARLSDRAAALSEKSLAQARRVDVLVADASRRAERYLDDATVRFGSAVERTALRVDAHLASRAERVRAHPLLQRLSGAAALVRGVQRALEMWQATAATADGREEDDDEGFEDDGSSPVGGPPADPSPA